MLSEACALFREDFEPARPTGHESACVHCREWAVTVRSFGSAGCALPLPEGLRLRLTSVGERGAGEAAAVPLPQLSLPPELRAKLYRIPSDARLAKARRHAPAGSTEVVAASLVFAVLVTLGAGDVLTPSDHPKLSAASRVAGAVLKEAGTRGTQTLLGAGEGILDGFLKANRTLEDFLGRITEPKREEPKAPEAAPPTPPPERKETPHGSRPTH